MMIKKLPNLSKNTIKIGQK